MTFLRLLAVLALVIAAVLIAVLVLLAVLSAIGILIVHINNTFFVHICVSPPR